MNIIYIHRCFFSEFFLRRGDHNFKVRDADGELVSRMQLADRCAAVQAKEQVTGLADLRRTYQRRHLADLDASNTVQMSRKEWASRRKHENNFIVRPGDLQQH
ncbi:hypothetical protein QAD02_005575 [Eretmocerus hayati]|uniref:Uncharacterized protein n=1 Tax=Eretmocerus hayati TaxID=131215 RepID=A0ACC2NTW7_9HYME|nr:hypothetical protein QAD02_005575 [Eretmocerus hayati]